MILSCPRDKMNVIGYSTEPKTPNFVINVFFFEHYSTSDELKADLFTIEVEHIWEKFHSSYRLFIGPTEF